MPAFRSLLSADHYCGGLRRHRARRLTIPFAVPQESERVALRIRIRLGIAPEALSLIARRSARTRALTANGEHRMSTFLRTAAVAHQLPPSAPGVNTSTNLEEDAMMSTRRGQTAAFRLGLCMLVAVIVIGAMAVTLHASGVRVTHAVRPPTRPLLTASMSEVDSALSRGDVSRAVVAWHSAYVAALSSRRWDRLIEVGDAWLRIERASDAPASGAAKARELYLSALVRARQQGSVEGVLRAAAAFDALGDREIAANAKRMAAALEEKRLAADNGLPVF